MGHVRRRLLSAVHFHPSKVVHCGTRGDDVLPDCINVMTTADSTLLELRASRERFLEVVANIRPELHRFCERMIGSVADAEDVLQDTLVRAYASLSELSDTARLRSWLFRMAYNQAIDYLRSYEHRMRDSLDDTVTDESARSDDTTPADEALAREEAVRAAITRFVELPPLQRSCVILKDVLDHSLQEIAELLEISVPAVQAALHRARARPRALRSIVQCARLGRIACNARRRRPTRCRFAFSAPRSRRDRRLFYELRTTSCVACGARLARRPRSACLLPRAWRRAAKLLHRSRGR